MDLIKQLITAKQSSADEYANQLKEMISEIIIYEKLSKSPKFTHIVETPLLQKKLPTIWKAFEGDIYYGGLFGVAINISNYMLDQQPVIYTDYIASRNKKQLKQADIFGKLGNNFIYRNLNSYQLTDGILFGITHDIEPEETDGDNEILKRTRTVIITHNESTSTYRVYQGIIEQRTDEKKEEDDENKTYKIEPFILDIQGLMFSLLTYSIQGNNSYDFATIEANGQQWHVNMPKHNVFRFTNEETQQQIYYQLTTDEEAAFNMNKANITLFAKSCVAYFVKGVSQHGNN